MQKHSFRGYFAPSGLVPLLRNGANRQHGHKIHSLRSVCTFRGYFVAALLVPPSAGRTDSTGTKYTPCGVCALSGTTSSLRSSCRRRRRGEPTAPAQNTLLAECVHFQGLLRRCAPRAAFGGANRHPRTTVRSILFYRSDVVLPLKTQSKKMRNAEAFLIFLVHFQGLEPWAH